MLLSNRFISYGQTLFKYRGYQHLPLLLVLLVERDCFFRVTENLWYDALCILVAFSGLLVRVLTVAFVHESTSGRNTLRQKAVELNTTGAYSVVRNPLYVGNYLILLGISMLTQDYRIVLINSLIFLVNYVLIISAEEAFLLDKFGAEYQEFAQRVNCVLPSFRNFMPPARGFSLIMVLKREHDTLFTTTLSLFCVKQTGLYFSTGKVIPPTFWLVFFGSVVIVWGILKFLKKTDRLLIPETCQ